MKNTSVMTAVMILLILTSGCSVVTPKSRFAEFYERESYPKDIDIVIDTLILSDISGSDIGVNRQKNMEAMSIIESTIKKSFSDRGYAPNVVFHGNGAYYTLDDKSKYFYSEGWESTDEVYNGPVLAEHEALWGDEEVRVFMRRLLEQAKVANKKVTKNKKKRQRRNQNKEDIVPPITRGEIPASIMALPSDLFVLVNLSGGEVSAAKSVGTGILTGALSAALTGGMYVYVGTSVSATNLEVVVFDKTQSRVAWHNLAQGPKYNAMSTSAESLLKTFPTTTGEQYPPPKKKR